VEFLLAPFLAFAAAAYLALTERAALESCMKRLRWTAVVIPRLLAVVLAPSLHTNALSWRSALSNEQIIATAPQTRVARLAALPGDPSAARLALATTSALRRACAAFSRVSEATPTKASPTR